jgi:hypothetical protein
MRSGPKVFVGVALLTLSAPALAQDGGDVDGQSCVTSAECGGGLRCVEGRCRDVDAVLRGEHAPTWGGSFGHKAMFGDGRDYGTIVAVTDVAAAVTEPLLVAATLATNSANTTSAVLGVISFLPVTLSGPIVHFIHGRPIPGIISFFTWASVAGTTFAVAGLFGLAFGNGEFSNGAAFVGGIAFGAGAGALVTWLDVTMARRVAAPEVKVPATSVRWMPGVVPTPGGAMASIGGTW